MARVNFDRGSTVTIEAQIKERTPFNDTPALINSATTPTITVTDSAGTEKVSAQNMTNSATGKYYYHIQTAANWITGWYTVSVSASNASYTDITASADSFNLV